MTAWMLVNILNGEMTHPYDSIPPQYYFGWIETNVTIGSTVRLGDGNCTVIGERVIDALGMNIDCWEVEMIFSYPIDLVYTMWYDKATGLWIGGKMQMLEHPDYYSLILLVDTNIPVGGALKIAMDKPIYERLEIATVTVTYVDGTTPVENASIMIQVNYPNGTLYFSWVTHTDANGVGTFSFFIEENAPYGTYSVYASAYKQGLEPKTTSTTFTVAYLEPHLNLHFEADDTALVNMNTTVILHICNSGNATAYNVNAALNIPSTLTIIWANTTFTGELKPGAEIELVAIVTTQKPGRHLFTACATYTKLNGTPMSQADAQKTLVFGYHQDYPVDLTAMTVTLRTNQIVVNMTITNYGDSPVQIALVVSAQHVSSNLVLPSSYVILTINPGQTVTISLTINIPSTAPTGEYLVQGILATGLPSEEGFVLTYEETSVTR